jgi:hypothetical protein
MAGQFDVNIVQIPVVLTGATEIPLLKVPTTGGGITVQSVYMINAGTTVAPRVITMTNVGTPALSGTIASYSTAAGTITESATIPAAFVISDGWVDGGEWIGFDQASGTVPAGSFLSVAYVTGR